ncbi:MoxR family ATPase [Dactylosporangium maewongense]|uniref:MoxR family ATPase n=1 Tax=Dactylosporangium maewongense TaxID=634393 RepID=A0ABP4NEU1_9ACTN
MVADLLWLQRSFDIAHAAIEAFVKGKSEAVESALICVFAGGHLLIEDRPGVAKTSLARAIARVFDGAEFQRIQFTPDLLPSDLTGTEIYDESQHAFRFREGPVFTNVLLGDEINRASPKVQSALLQVMAEGRVTVGRQTHSVPTPFCCIATQNPVDFQGTYALPEAQLDRFLMRISIGYPDPLDEIDVITLGVSGRTADDVEPVLAMSDLRRVAGIVQTVEVNDPVKRYIVDIAEATRTSEKLRLGVSPRGCIALATAARVRAATRGREFTAHDDVKALAQEVLGHRILLSDQAELDGATAEQVLATILDTVPVQPAPASRR